MRDETVSRRVFVKAGGLALVSMGIDPTFLTRAAYATQRGSATYDRKKTLVCVFQRGAVDGLSLIVPHGDPYYYKERPRLAVPTPGKPNGAIDLDGHFGFHPSLAPLLPLYRSGVLAAVHAVGSPNPTRSHFDAQDYMESGTPGIKSTADGWLNRQLKHSRAHEDTPFKGVAIGSSLPRILRGDATALSVANLASFGFGGRPEARDRIAGAFRDLYAETDAGLMASSAEEAFEAVKMLEAAKVAGREPAHGASYPNDRFGSSMAQIAQLIHADLGLEIAFADVDGWDTHFNQGAAEGQLATKLRSFGRALAAFVTDLGPRMADVVLLTMSEFGRTVAENGSRGTDHGRATAMLVLGGPTRGGRVYGRWPTLSPEDRADGRDLAVTTDFRDLFGEVLTGHLGTKDLSPIFPGHLLERKRWLGVLG